MKYQLAKPWKPNSDAPEITELELDFDKLTAADFNRAALKAKSAGDAPSVYNGLMTPAMGLHLLSQLTGIFPEDLERLPLRDYKNIFSELLAFFIGLE